MSLIPARVVRKSSGTVDIRHSEINAIINKALTACQVPSQLEPLGLCRADGKRPDGATLIPWRLGKSLIWDATVVDTFATSHVQVTSKLAGSAARKAEDLKRTKYRELEGRNIFLPFAAETTGVIGPDALYFIGQIGQRMAITTGEVTHSSLMKQRISVAIQRVNAVSVLGTFGSSFKSHLLAH